MDETPSLIKLLDSYQQSRELSTLPLKTWAETKSFDDCVTHPQLLVDLVKNAARRCPHLCQKDTAFFYCGKDIPKEYMAQLSPFDRVYRSQQGAAELQLFCLDKYEECVYFTSKQASPGSTQESRQA